MAIIQQLAFILVFGYAMYSFSKKMQHIIANIKTGKPEDRTDRPGERFKRMVLFALGQKKMFQNMIPAVLHFFVYIGFILINIEILEIVIDGIFGTHRVFAQPLGGVYLAAINFFEILAVLVLSACVIFWIRRNVLKIDRFQSAEMTAWPKKDANIILYAEIVLMIAILVMNGADLALQAKGAAHYHQTGTFMVSGLIAPMFAGLSESVLIFIERFAWWAHIIGVLIFLNFVPHSKHLHILLAFPNSYYSDLDAPGKMKNMPRIMEEVKLMMDPEAEMPEMDESEEPEPFGAKDVEQLSWKSLLDAYSCTECGRCTAACPANQTGKLLSPRKIMMDTRDRMEDKAKNRAEHGADHDDGKTLVHDYITTEELKACTSCNACVQECPVSINPLSIITELRRYLILEEANSPEEWNMMFNNVENNSAPWQFSPSDRAKWVEDV